MRDGGGKREGENILLHPSVSAFLGDKNMVCQSQSRVKMWEWVCARSTQGAGVQSRSLITSFSTHTHTHSVTHTKLCLKCDNCSNSDRLWRMRLIFDRHLCPCSCVCLGMRSHGFEVCMIWMLNLTRWAFPCDCRLSVHLQVSRCGGTCSVSCHQCIFMEQGPTQHHLLCECAQVCRLGS